MPTHETAFALPARLTAKSAPALIAADERHFSAIRAALAAERAGAARRLAEVRGRPGRSGEAALERDLEVHRLAARLRLLDRFGIDACLGRMVPDGDAPVYIGRFGLSGPDGERLLVDWRAPAAEPFFGATPARPMGLQSRRRYRWSSAGIVDYWDEALGEGTAGLAPDEQSAFIASLGASRSPRMRDVLATIQADQDAIIRADSPGTLVIDGGPGTGKTVVALHRAAYLQYADPRLGPGRGGVLFVGPSGPYLSYVDDVLPSLGEEGVRICTLRDLVPLRDSAGAADNPAASDNLPDNPAVTPGGQARGRTPARPDVASSVEVPDETDPRVAELKADARWERAIEPAVALYEEPPSDALVIETPWAEVHLTADDWADAFTAGEPGIPHNDTRDQVWEALVDIVLERHGEAEVPERQLRTLLARTDALVRAFARAWPVLSPYVVVADLWTVPAYLRRCAPWLTPDEVAALQRTDGAAWTTADLPLLDAARRRIGDPAAVRIRRRREAAQAARKREMDRVVDELIAADGSELRLSTILRGDDAQNSLIDERELPHAETDDLAGPFSHVIVDEAQELTDAQWQMLVRRCPSRSFTIVGDRAQARHGFTASWAERLARIGLANVRERTLTINYRTPQEIMDAAEPVIRTAIPDATVPTSVRTTGIPVRHGAIEELDRILDAWLATHEEGTAAVIGMPVPALAGADPGRAAAGPDPRERVRQLTPERAKGLEFDLVILVDPAEFGAGVTGAVDRYVAMTRATRELVVLGG